MVDAKKEVHVHVEGDGVKTEDASKDTLEFLEGDARQEDLAEKRERLEIELREEKADTQRRMAWMAMASMLVFTVVLFTQIVSDTRVTALADLFGLFYIAQASVVGAYMGFTSYLQAKK
jgi:hypothetical protein